MRQDLIYLLLFIAFLLITLQMFVLFWLSKMLKFTIQRSPGIKEVRIGDKAPHFSALDIQGHEVQLKSLLREKNVCLLFIDTNCSICKGILPHMQHLTSRYDIQFVIINENTVMDDTGIQKLLSPSLIYIKSPEIFRKYVMRTVPQAILVNQTGFVQNRNLIPDIEVLQDLLDNYLEEQTA
ncbi:AhpC/TSA family protein [Bacillus sp. 491mf]|uniref:peroxiredoxin family protein n=1 Tax=Bacillus sp. 491mf TaxID=1761755 RepID=UPI0008E40E1C|nr:redoxin domain-containing protein [Bacillus sp. 491mf]SFD13771.1 AhpC/TSA family protein [Bacillus sp. 491mf]